MRLTDASGTTRWQPANRRDPCHFGSVPHESFTWTNQGTGTATQRGGAVLLTAPAATGDLWRVRYLTAPAPPYSLVAAFWPLLMPSLLVTEAPAVAVGWRDGGFGSLALFRIYYDNGTQFTLAADFSHWGSPSIFSAVAAGPVYTDWLQLSGAVWVRLRDDGTNRHVALSPDGQDWSTWATEARANFLTPTQLCFAANADNVNYPAIMKILEWRYE